MRCSRVKEERTIAKMTNEEKLKRIFVIAREEGLWRGKRDYISELGGCKRYGVEAWTGLTSYYESLLWVYSDGHYEVNTAPNYSEIADSDYATMENTFEYMARRDPVPGGNLEKVINFLRRVKAEKLHK